MHFAEPKVIALAWTAIDPQAEIELFTALGGPNWSTDALTDSEELVEIAGRLCYKAFGVGLNANLTKVREGNREYIANILKQRHGSVLEHATVTFALLNVSRILTHELVRHRAGASYSQESGRFVRIDDIGFVYPDALADGYLASIAGPKNPNVDPPDVGRWARSTSERVRTIISRVLGQIEDGVKEITELTGLDNPNLPFSVKKTLTSAIRRIAPNGQVTNIIVTANHRAWRHLIEVRTAPGAEQEIQSVFFDIGEYLKVSFPNIYQDMHKRWDEGAGLYWWQFDNSKV